MDLLTVTHGLVAAGGMVGGYLIRYLIAGWFAPAPTPTPTPAPSPTPSVNPLVAALMAKLAQQFDAFIEQMAANGIQAVLPSITPAPAKPIANEAAKPGA